MIQRFEAMRAINEALDKADLDRREKRRVKAALRWRPGKRDEILGLVTAECHVEGLVTEDGDVEAAVNWDEIIDLIVRLLPQILSIVRLFF